MPELRKDPVTDRWVIISTDRRKRPSDFRTEYATLIGSEHCPFCPGQERMTPPEILAFRDNGTGPNTPGWSLRVVPNKYPALQVEGSLDRQGEGLFDRMNGIGAHEVFIETPDHAKTMSTMSETEIERVVKDYLRYRKDTQPLTEANAGCVFKNPGPQTAGQLVEAAGLKGEQVGGAQVSTKHANFIVNRGRASAADVLALIRLVQDRVKAASGVDLQLELKVVGEG